MAIVAPGSGVLTAGRVISFRSIGVLHCRQIFVPSGLGVRQCGQTMEATFLWVIFHSSTRMLSPDVERLIYFESPGASMNRRHFLRAGAAGAISLDKFPYHLFAASKPKNATDRMILGPRKIELSRMAMGTGTIGSNGSSNQTRKLGYRGLSELFRTAYDQKINFWDSADAYGSHTYLREALKTIPREKVVIMSKTQATTAAGMKADLDRFRRELGVDYIDILLLHVQTAPDWNMRQRPVMDVITE